MTALLNTIVMQLVAAVTNGLATTQSLGAAGNLTLNGSLVTNGVGVFDVARRVGITSVGNDSGITWTITGTNRYGRAQKETLTGATAGNTVQSVQDYATVTSIAASAATAGNVTAGTTTVASSNPIAIDYFANPASIAAAVTFNGTANMSIEVANDDVMPNYDLIATPPTWFTANGFTSISSNTAGQIAGPLTLMRITINSGTGQVTTRINQAFVAGKV